MMPEKGWRGFFEKMDLGDSDYLTMIFLKLNRYEEEKYKMREWMDISIIQKSKVEESYSLTLDF
jgi:hypothetical protein